MWRQTSDCSDEYNCIAWALRINNLGLWPWGDWEWPRPKPAVVTVQEFIDVFAMFGFVQCASFIFEAGYEKIALYVRAGDPQHAARQLQDGRWTSKLGNGIDIIHDLLSDFPTRAPYGPCTSYGSAQYFFKRRSGAQHPDYSTVAALSPAAATLTEPQASGSRSHPK
jgi:hypothetical protein